MEVDCRKCELAITTTSSWGCHYLEGRPLFVGSDEEGESEETSRKRYTPHC